LKYIVAVYVGIFLAFPVCLCQVYEVLGVDSLEHAAVSKVMEPSIGSPAVDAILHCHCDDDCDKATELIRSENEITKPFVVVAVISSMGLPPSRSVDDYPRHQSRAPPDLETWSLSSYSGVFLL
jgi:hypothetical protein